MFIITEDWLRKYYGSHDEEQVKQAVAWLRKYGKNITEEKIERWKHWKHLMEYQVNTELIVDDALEAVKDKYEFTSELAAHRWINLMRVPLARCYEDACYVVRPHSILELGVGGDSAISTAVLLRVLEAGGPPQGMLSVDRNYLGVTWERYKNVPFWKFEQADSIKTLTKHVSEKRRWDLVFIDTDHSYLTTREEIALAGQITDSILLDDASFTGNADDSVWGGVNKAIREVDLTKWDIRYFHGDAVALMRRR